MDNLIIFIAEKFFILSPIIAGYVFYKSPREVQKKMLIFGLFAFPLAYLLSVAAKELYFSPLPFALKGFEPLIAHAPNNGFPSDHTLLLSSIAGLVSFFHKKGAITLWIITVLVGFSRMYAGVHHFVDIIGAVIISLLSVFAVHAIMRKYYGEPKPTE